MTLPDDFRDMLLCLSDAGAEFVVVGGFAVAHHGHVRATKDIDVFVKPSAENAERILRALRAFGAPTSAIGISERDFASEGKIIQIGLPPLRIDLITVLSGLDFDAATREAGALDIDGRSIRVIGLNALLQNKRAAGRPQDLADVAVLERLLVARTQKK